MKKNTTVLISNIELPSNKIGSWVTRISKFINNNNDFFDFILSPSSTTQKSVFCKKRNFLTYNFRLRNLLLKKWVAKDYVNAIIKLSKSTELLKIIVVDDSHLLEALSLIKDSLTCKVELIFSFHGFNLKLKESILDKTDKVLFLTKLSYQNTFKEISSFTPEVFIIGNGVDSDTFYPLKEEKKNLQKKELGFNFNEQIICWLSNNRRKKGLHIFLKFIDKVNKLSLPIKFLVIGSNKIIKKENVLNIGRISNKEVAQYLQISDFYLFTSLWQEGFGLSLVEAIKSGNTIFTSNRGGIPEVVKNIDNVHLINSPNILNEWITKFEKVYTSNLNNTITVEVASKIWNYQDWEDKFKKAILE